MTSAPSPGSRPPVPPPLTVAVSLVVVEAAVFLLLAVAEAVEARGEALALGVTTALFFLLYGGALAFCGWRLYQRESWARAPVVLAQLIQLLVGGSFWGGSTTPVAVIAILVAVLVLAGIFHPRSLAALEAED